jgi:oligopeptide/dipeptide ABC transporter ATP-binding protein
MAQRVVIGIAMLLRPDLVIADEPTTGLDVTIQSQILELFARAVREDGAGALLVTHDLGVVANYCSRVYVMYGGRVVETGPVGAVFARPRHPYTAGLLRSVPVIGQPLLAMPGQAPTLRRAPVGCTFVDRCPHALPECEPEPPPWREPEPGRGFLCQLPEGEPE